MELLNKWEKLFSETSRDEYSEEIIFFSASNSIVPNYSREVFGKYKDSLYSVQKNNVEKLKIKILNNLNSSQIETSVSCFKMIIPYLTKSFASMNTSLELRVDSEVITCVLETKDIVRTKEIDVLFSLLKKNKLLKEEENSLHSFYSFKHEQILKITDSINEIESLIIENNRINNDF